ncbi:MAG: hypothetical protein GW779_04555 [Candidatus Altiarchaeum hamiconexum]|uniref:DUF1616 domain-containing protein n=1 Tax=Candidatus Altarchaeum hamiconexum TaxID=1803513 RepID=A0A8J7YS79_9ARCH|nr:hypothetical protein [Candidatus Altarchaeum hamiconexum]OIQ05283.1 MAG: hypothetical protein AUK59_04480 [Candidatus Altarchaeum sp. CG2_30_32_3053]PIN67892.1 MAG: hypothetical protein COV98_01170 [Candidatus Altarchaeum sp. CG12_big_fil_rev_8_21_14_0_65_33_22]PIV28453.1 MAG: hypothetical protein COS36_02095 [Candidatus Altarchaeum sp. CG03_land_8_20_14_0_80_32_618]PIX49202.1 MAG: hypothetical protein COZ53_01370 [Candidatus Altarchaeum sp. CG_4_8_14_3_um_filter_33_2054]PIZ29468.1 MAG: hyp
MAFLHDPMTLFEVLYSAVIIIGIVVISGFCLTLAIFPKRDEIEIIERLGLSVILGFTPFVMLYFFDKNFNVPINFITSVLFVVIVCIAGLAIWIHRKGMTKQKI